MGSLVLKDVFAAGQPLLIGLAIDSLSARFRAPPSALFAGGLVLLSVAQGRLPVLHARDPYRHLSRYRIRSPQ